MIKWEGLVIDVPETATQARYEHDHSDGNTEEVDGWLVGGAFLEDGSENWKLAGSDINDEKSGVDGGGIYLHPDKNTRQKYYANEEYPQVIIDAIEKAQEGEVSQ